jgi:hypothetical protein
MSGSIIVGRALGSSACAARLIHPSRGRDTRIRWYDLAGWDRPNAAEDVAHSVECIELRGQFDDYGAAMKELVRRKVDIIFATVLETP